MWVKGGCRGIFSCNGVLHVKCDPCDPGSECPTHPAISVCKCVAAPPPPPAPKYMLLDETLLETRENTTLVFAEFAKDANNPMVCEEKPWEVAFRHMYASVILDPASASWRCYYSSWLQAPTQPVRKMACLNSHLI